MNSNVRHLSRRCFALSALSVGTSLFSTNRLWAESTQTLFRGPTGTDVPTGTTRPFSTLKQIEAGVLNIGYADVGPANGRPVILLHGWPYDIHSFVDVVPLLALKGYRVIVPYLRGFGTTQF